MAACDRCEKVGDLACIQFLGEKDEPILALALHKNGTVDVPDMRVEVLTKLLGYVTQVWLDTCLTLVGVLTQRRAPNLTHKEFNELIEAGFLKLRYYSTMEGALRERARSEGIVLEETVLGATQAPGRA
jgi:hypothetical protein